RRQRMTAAAPLSLPGSRSLLGWWRDLAPRRPRRLWFGQFRFHHVEALVRVADARRVDPLQQALLRALSLHAPPGPNGPPAAGALAGLHLDPQVLLRLLHQLAGEGLVRGNGDWHLTGAGREALEGGAYVRHAE